MHLWPSMRLRDSFKKNYLSKLEWNLHRMNTEKQQQRNQPNSNQQKLLESDKSHSDDPGCGGVGMICREVVLILSCCYCCFCCGACVEDDQSS